MAFAGEDGPHNALPVQPLRSLMTLASWMLSWASAFCIRWMHVLTAWTWSAR
jgi:hypothetical protein